LDLRPKKCFCIWSSESLKGFIEVYIQKKRLWPRIRPVLLHMATLHVYRQKAT